MVPDSYFGYDETTPTATSGIPQHTSGTSAGNLTSAHVSAGSTYLTTTTAYYDTGMPVSTTDPGGFTTTYGYDSTGTFTTSTALPTPASGASLGTSATYDPASGALLTSTGMNSDTTVINNYDAMLRPTTATLPTGGQVALSYTPTSQFATWNIGNNTNGSAASQLDGYGRTTRQARANGQTTKSWYQADTCYDATGLPLFVSVPYQGNGVDGSASQCSGAGTTYAYDTLGRVTSVTTADGTATTTYNNRAVQTIDVNGVSRITQYDLLGRISGVCELTQQSQNGVNPVACGMDIAGTGFVTSYTYNLDSRQITVTQGNQQRIVQNDPAGRPTLVQEPERGSTTYSYTYNNYGLQVTRTRPRANQTDGSVLTHTVTQYDALGRVISTTYDDGTPNRNFYYDQGDQGLGWSQQPSNPMGRLIGTNSGSGSTLARNQFAYDISGNLITAWQCAPSICGTGNQESRPPDSATYDFTGQMITSFDVVSGYIAYNRSVAGEVTSIQQKTYTDPGNAPNLVTSVTNGPLGPTNWGLGNGLFQVQSYDSVGRNNGVWLCQGTQANSSFYCPQSSSQVYGSTVNLTGTRTRGICDTVLSQCQSAGYDDLNRLTSLTGSSSGNTSYTWAYDQYGNRLSQSMSPGNGNQFNSTFNNNNQATGYGIAYDAAGNQTGDGSNSYQYDAEGNVVSVNGGSTASYVYDALNRRVSVTTSAGTTEHMYNTQGQRSSSWVVSNNIGREGRIHWDGKQIAYRSYNGGTYFQHKSPLGTDRMRTDYQGLVANRQVSGPFGDTLSQSNPDPLGPGQDNDQFAGLEHDGESNTEHATFRQYNSTQGRWMSPDPYDGSYDLFNPQSLNRYAYVLNNPLTDVDPNGLYCEYFTDANDGTVEEFDYHSTTNECSNTGGHWFPDGSGSIDASVPPMDTSTGGLIGYGSGFLGNAPSSVPTISPAVCTGAAIAGGASAGALIGEGVGGFVGGLLGSGGGTLVAPGVGTVGGGIAGASAGAGIGAGVGGFIGGLVGGAASNILCSKGGGPSFGGNSRQNKQANDAKRDAEKEVGKRMTDAQEERFHDEVTHQGLGYWEMREIAVQILRGAI